MNKKQMVWSALCVVGVILGASSIASELGNIPFIEALMWAVVGPTVFLVFILGILGIDHVYVKLGDA